MGREKTMGGTYKAKDLIIFSNSPGEVSGWVTPFVEILTKRRDITDTHRVVLVIHPCQFGSGRDSAVVSGLGGIDHVVPPREYLRLIFWNTWKRSFGSRKDGVIISLGGSLKHPVLFKKRTRLGFPLFAYTDNPGLPGSEDRYERIFVRSEGIREKYLSKGLAPSKVEAVGDLIFSSVKTNKNRGASREELSARRGERVIALMPGSRDFEVLHMLPIFLRAASDISEMFDRVKFVFLKSPYVTRDVVVQALSPGDRVREEDGLPGRLMEDRKSGSALIEFSGDKILRVLEGGLDRWGSALDFALTLPGTNTIQLAYRKIPHLVVAPLNKPEIIPFVGALALFRRLPFVKPLIRKAVLAYAGRFRFVGLPNIYANEEIVPELFGVLETKDIVDKLAEILDGDRMRSIAEKLGRFGYSEDPAEKIVARIWGERRAE
jgi:lipid-A-disaccharide synthase